MLKRLGLGLLKGLLIGGAIGAALQFGLGWETASGLLGFLLAMGVAGTTGVFAGRPPWHEGAWIEASLKGLVGVGIGALLYWGLSWVSSNVTWIPTVESWASLPAVFAPSIAAVYGSLVELDNTGDAGKDGRGKGEGKGGKGPKARVAVDDDLDELDEIEPARAAKKRRA